MAVPFLNLQRHYHRYREPLEAAIQRVCSSAQFVLGPEVEAFERHFAEYIGVREAVGVATGTDALMIAAWALGLKAGDEILVPANTFIATALAAHRLGAVPVPVDVDSDTFLLDLSDAERRMTANTRLIMPVHLYGQAANMDEVLFFAKKHGLVVVEDACQAHGATWKGKRVGGFGSAAAFSFYPGKNLGAFGDGGMITTNDSALADAARLWRNYGSARKYEHLFPGGNSRLDAIQAAVLDVKLQHLDEWNARRFRIACRYIDGLRHVSGVRLPAFDPSHSTRHVFHLYVIRSQRRDELLVWLQQRGIQAQIHYPVSIHLHPAFSHLGHGPGTSPVAERLAQEILSLPMDPELEDVEIDEVIGAIKAFHE